MREVERRVDGACDACVGAGVEVVSERALELETGPPGEMGVSRAQDGELLGNG